MGREVRRVPSDFSWPIGKRWVAKNHGGGIDAPWNDPPPIGDGWQLWYHCPDLSWFCIPLHRLKEVRWFPQPDEWVPISPVFATREGLVAYMTQPSTRDSGFAWDRGYTRESAEALVKHGSCMSMAILNGAPMDGTQALVEMDKERSTEYVPAPTQKHEL